MGDIPPRVADPWAEPQELQSPYTRDSFVLFSCCLSSEFAAGWEGRWEGSLYPLQRGEEMCS